MVSVPVAARTVTTAGELGNRVGVLPVDLPAVGDPQRRLAAVAATTRARKTSAPGTSAALLAPLFRGLARLGIFRWYVNRQRRVTTFVTNLRGPGSRVSLLGATVTDVIPMSLITGNVTVAFAALSYAGTLVVTVVADAVRCPDLPLLAARLQREFDDLTVVRSHPVL